MRTTACTLLLTVLAGCVTRWETYPESLASPEDAYLTLRAAVLSEQPAVLYSCLSPTFREQHGIRGYPTFKLWYEQSKEEFEDLATFLAKALVRQADRGSGRVLITAYGREVELRFVPAETVSVTAAFDGYPPERFDYREPWRGSIRLEGARVLATHPLDPDLGILSPKEVEELRFHRRWLLEEVTGPDGAVLSLPGVEAERR